MARKPSLESSDDDCSGLDDFINKHVQSMPALNAPKLNPSSRTPILLSPSRTAGQRLPKTISPQKQAPSSRTGCDSLKAVRKPLKKTSVNSQQEPVKSQTSASSTLSTAVKARATPHRTAKKVADYRTMVDLTGDTDEEEIESEESVYQTCDSDVESELEAEPELPSRNAFLRLKQLEIKESPLIPGLMDVQLKRHTPDTELSGSDSEDLDSNIFKSRSPRKGLKTYKSPAKPKYDLPLDSFDYSDKENDSRAAIVLPPSTTIKKKTLHSATERPSTPSPPPSPSKSKLVSPSKKKARIPTPPHRPSIDAFWNVHAVNDWNDQYSPEKPLVSPKKNRFLPREDSSDSPLSSPRKSQSPTKRSRAAVEAKKDFESRRHQICEDFFAELDREITGGKIQEMAAATGGVRFVWSKTLNSTAGRANWREERRKSKSADGTIEVTRLHHASIELAEKVIDDEERLLNVVAHEFCHLANFMVSGIKDQPHGRQFKAWGAKCTNAFGHRGVEVTTKHSYTIDYKYIWTCTNQLCEREFKRHSKSIDPTRQTCGVCRGGLVQTKPVPRKQASKAGVGGYAGFVKEHFAAIKKEMAGAPHKEVMAAVGQLYRERKAAAEKAGSATATVAEVDDMVKALEVVTLD